MAGSARRSFFAALPSPNPLPVATSAIWYPGTGYCYVTFDGELTGDSLDCEYWPFVVSGQQLECFGVLASGTQVAIQLGDPIGAGSPNGVNYTSTAGGLRAADGRLIQPFNIMPEYG